MYHLEPWQLSNFISPEAVKHKDQLIISLRKLRAGATPTQRQSLFQLEMHITGYTHSMDLNHFLQTNVAQFNNQTDYPNGTSSVIWTYLHYFLPYIPAG